MKIPTLSALVASNAARQLLSTQNVNQPSSINPFVSSFLNHDFATRTLPASTDFSRNSQQGSLAVNGTLSVAALNQPAWNGSKGLSLQTTAAQRRNEDFATDNVSAVTIAPLIGTMYRVTLRDGGGYVPSELVFFSTTLTTTAGGNVYLSLALRCVVGYNGILRVAIWQALTEPVRYWNIDMSMVSDVDIEIVNESHPAVTVVNGSTNNNLVIPASGELGGFQPYIALYNPAASGRMQFELDLAKSSVSNAKLGNTPLGISAGTSVQPAQFTIPTATYTNNVTLAVKFRATAWKAETNSAGAFITWRPADPEGEGLFGIEHLMGYSAGSHSVTTDIVNLSLNNPAFANLHLGDAIHVIRKSNAGINIWTKFNGNIFTAASTTNSAKAAVMLQEIRVNPSMIMDLKRLAAWDTALSDSDVVGVLSQI